MKSALYIVCFVVLTLSLKAQSPVITRANLFNLGDKYLRIWKYDISTQNMPLGPEGSNVTWDFSAVDFNHPSVIKDTLNAVEPYNTPYFSNHPGTSYNTSNFCLRYDNKPNYSSYPDYFYYILTDQKLQFLGNHPIDGVNEKIDYTFSKPRVDLIFPMSYHNESLNDYESRYVDGSGSGLHCQKGTCRIFADGYGTLKLQNGRTINNCLRIKRTITTRDSSHDGVINRIDSSYIWYSMETKGPILEINILLNNNKTAYYYMPLNPTSVENEFHTIDKGLSCYPNPFNSSATITYKIPKVSHVEINIFDALGRKITDLVNKEQSAGDYNILFDASSLPSGIYIYTIQAGQYRDSRKFLLLK